MAGRKKEPIELIQAKGKKHLTKEEIKNRMQSEVKVKSDNIEAPEDMDEELKIIFYKYAVELKEVGILTNLDVSALERYVVAEVEYRRYTKQLLSLEKMGPRYKLLKGLQSKALNECRSTAADLGMTPSSRVKLVAPKVEKEKPKNKFERFAK